MATLVTQIPSQSDFEQCLKQANIKRLAWVTPTPISIHTLSTTKNAPPIQLLIKHDGLLHRTHPSLYGGNKIRKLDFILAQVLQDRVEGVATVGSEGSHHILATITAARALGLEVHIATTSQEHSQHSQAIYTHSQSLATSLHPLAIHSTQDFNQALRQWRTTCLSEAITFIPTGGSSVLGVLGMVEAVYELIDQLTEEHLRTLTEIYIPTASGSSLAGLLLGIALAWPDPYPQPTVSAIRVSPKPLINRQKVLRLYHKASQLLGCSCPLPHFSILGDYYGQGYGLPTTIDPQVHSWGQAHQLYFDPTYTAKAFSALFHRTRRLDHKRRRHQAKATLKSSLSQPDVNEAHSILFWHTLDERPPHTLDLACSVSLNRN